ncbi:MAG TPA: EamA family transporter [Magnetospirillaceae bacterium]|jgi:O-acetylserine/cysteine efflux transporter
MPPFHIFLAVLVTLVWGGTFVFIKWGLDAFPPLTFAALRFACASLPFLLIYPSRGGVKWKWIIGIGLFLGVGQFGLLFTGMKLGMPPGLTSAVVQTHAFFTVLFAILFLKERPSWQNFTGLALAFAGVVVIAGNLGAVPLLPFLCVIGGAACWGVSNILTRQSGADNALRLIVWASLVPPIPLMLLSWATEGSDAIAHGFEHVTWLAIVSVAVVSFGATNLAFGMWSFLLRKHRAAVVAPYALLVPLFGISTSMVILRESISTTKWIGCGLIVAGVAANSWPAHKAVVADTETPG